MEQIIVTVSAEAEVTVEVRGHPGPGCKALSKDIEQALGETTKDEPTRELQQTAETQVRAQHRH
jgi:hypothetical protein